MKIATIEQQKQWARTYKAAAIKLEEQRSRELRALTEEEAWRKIEWLLSLPVPWRREPLTSGLIEQQALFHRRAQ